MNPQQPQKPAYKKGALAVFLAGTADKPAYDIVDVSDPKKQLKTRLGAHVGNYKLTPEEAFQLYIGNDAQAEMLGEKGPRTVFLFNRGITEKPKEVNGKTYMNRYLDLGVASPVYAEKGEKAGEIVGYRVRHPEAKGKEDKRQAFCWRFIGPKDNPIEIEPGQAYRLLRGESLTIPNRGVVSLKEITSEDVEKDGRTFTNYTADLNIEWAQSEKNSAYDMSGPDTDEPHDEETEEDAALAVA